MNKRSFLIILIIMVSFLAFGGAVAGLAYASTSPIQIHLPNTELEFIPDSGISYNPGLDCFDISNYYGLTYIGSNIVVDLIGTLGGSTQTGYSKPASLDSNYRQVANIKYESDYQTKGNSSFPINSTFSGIYDGQGYLLTNCPTIKIGSSSNYTSLFATSNGTVKNVRIFSNTTTALASSTSGNGTSSSPLVHSLLVNNNQGTIDNCIAEGNYTNSTKTYNVLGVFAGKSSGTIKNCTNNMNLSLTGANSNLSGIVSLPVGGRIIGNINNGNITGSSYTGGITSGYLTSSDFSVVTQLDIASNINNGLISASSYVGGISAYITATAFINFFLNINNGQVSASSSYSGGIVGHITTSDSASFISNRNTASIKSTNFFVAGIVGYSTITASQKEILLKNNYNEGSIESSSHAAGGIMGYSDRKADNSTYTIQSNVNNGEIKGIKTVGGIIAHIYSTSSYGGMTNIFANVNNGSITATQDGTAFTGGIIGQVVFYNYSGTIEANKNTGTVTANGGTNVQYLGGIIGHIGIYFDIIVRNNYNVAKLESTGSKISGIIGYANSVSNTSTLTVIENTNDGEITAASYVGGILGNFYAASSTGGALAATTNTNNGNLTATSGEVGGIVGQAVFYNKESLLEANINNGRITSASNYTGGIIGRIQAYCQIDIKHNVNNYIITSTSNYIGGIVGYIVLYTNTFSVSILRNVNNGRVISTTTSSSTYIAGICGHFYRSSGTIALNITSNINNSHILLSSSSSNNLNAIAFITTTSVTIVSSANENRGVLGYNYNETNVTYSTLPSRLSNVSL